MNVIEKIRELAEKYKNNLVIVEGIKDRAALVKLGFRNIYVIKKPLFKVVEEVGAKLLRMKTKECLILTDLDKEGKKIYSRLNSDLSQRGVKVDNLFRNFLYRKTSLSQIEGLISYMVKKKV